MEMMIMNMSETLSAAAILGAAQSGARVGRVNEEGDVTYGIARSIGNDTGGFGRGDQDVRGMFLRVTTRSGWEVFWPMAELMSDYVKGTFCVDVSFPS